MDFEKTLKELTKLVEEMEGGGLNLEKALKKFEQGIQLTRKCQTELQAAEQKVQQLIEKNGLETLADFEESDEE